MRHLVTINPEMEEYELIESIGFGSFSTVYKAKMRGDDINFNNYFAIKIAKIEEHDHENHKNEKDDRVLVYDRKRIEKEIQVWKPLDHENLCRLLKVFIDEKEEKVSFVMEYAKDGDLLTILSEKSLPKETVKNFFRQLCLAVGYLHENGVIHGDIKLENILIHGEKVKLSDFGLARRFEEGKINFHCNCGTVEYAAPELLQDDFVDDLFKADIWALGVALYALIYRRFPFDGPTPKILKIRVITSEPIFTEIDDFTELIELTKMLLEKNPKKRPNIKTILDLL